jgi:DNA-binding NarL/FixJ family response regulator
VHLVTDADRITVVLVTDSFLIGDGLTALLADIPDIEVVGRTGSFDELFDLVKSATPSTVIITIRSQVVSTAATVTAARRLRELHPSMAIMIISDRCDGFALELLRGGSSGIAFLLDEHLPDIAAVVGALRELRIGQTVVDPSVIDSFIRRGDTLGIEDLTRRETDVLELMAHGLSNRAIGEALHISVKSIEKAITAIFLKLNPVIDGSSDRRVSASLAFLRTQTDPFGPIVNPTNEGARIASL